MAKPAGGALPPAAHGLERIAALKGKVKALGFLMPALAVYLCVIVLPALFSLRTSFFAWDGVGKGQFVGLRNYVNLFTKDRIFLRALENNIIWVGLTVLFTVAVALLLALMLNQKFKGRIVYRAIFYFPCMLSWIIAGQIWKWIYNPNFGLVSTLTRLFSGEGLKTSFLQSTSFALLAVFAAALWQSVGQPMLYFLAGLQTLPRDVLEAARVDGASRFSLFFRVMLPMLKETFVIVLATQIIASLKVYDIIVAMTEGGPANATQTLATYMYNQTFTYNNYGQGSAIAMVMVLIMILIIIPYVKYTGRES